MKKDDIRKAILTKTYNPIRYFNNLYNEKEKDLKEK